MLLPVKQSVLRVKPFRFTRKTFSKRIGFTLKKTLVLKYSSIFFTRKTFDFTRKTFDFTRKTVIYDTNGLPYTGTTHHALSDLQPTHY